MAEDRNALLGVLAVRKGWAQPAEVLAAQVALAVNPDRTLAQELADAGALTHERERELELLAEKALAASGGNVQGAIAANGGLEVIAPPPSSDLFIDDESTTMRVPPPKPAASASHASLDDEDEPTKVLDWDRATRKSIEKVEPPPRKK